MKFTKSVRELAADINAAPDNYDSNDEVSEKCLSVEAEFEAAGVLCHEGEGAAGERRRTSHWRRADGGLVRCVEGEGATDGREDVAFPLATSGRRLG